MLVALLSLLPLLVPFTVAAPLSLDLEHTGSDVGKLVDLEPRQRGHRGGGWTRPTGTRVAGKPAAAAAATAPAATNPSAVSKVEPVHVPAPASDTTVAVPPVGTSAAPVADPPACLPRIDISATVPAGTAGAPGSSTAAGATAGTGNTGTTTGGTDGSAGSGPIGIGWDSDFNKADLTTYKAAGLQWWYNWHLQPSVDSIVEFVPMVWSKGNVPELAAAMPNWPDGTQYVLSFNEPDKPTDVGGTAMTEVESATLHNQIVKTLGGKYKISTPGVSRGNFAWMDAWLAACETLGGCHYDFVAYHYYGKDASDMISSIKQFHEKYGKEIWMTEWGCHEFPNNAHSCTKAEAETFMKTAIEWFRGEGASIVTRWAWFGAFEDMTNWHGTDNMDGSRIANADGTVNDFGKAYLTM